MFPYAFYSSWHPSFSYLLEKVFVIQNYKKHETSQRDSSSRLQDIFVPLDRPAVECRLVVT